MVGVGFFTALAVFANADGVEDSPQLIGVLACYGLDFAARVTLPIGAFFSLAREPAGLWTLRLALALRAATAVGLVHVTAGMGV